MSIHMYFLIIPSWNTMNPFNMEKGFSILGDFFNDFLVIAITHLFPFNLSFFEFGLILIN